MMERENEKQRSQKHSLKNGGSAGTCTGFYGFRMMSGATRFPEKYQSVIQFATVVESNRPTDPRYGMRPRNGNGRQQTLPGSEGSTKGRRIYGNAPISQDHDQVPHTRN
jgi:hypothetical protein